MKHQVQCAHLAVVLMGTLLHTTLAKSVSGNYIYATCHMEKHADDRLLLGNIDFRQPVNGGMTEVRVNLTGLEASDTVVQHGLTVHEYGDIAGDCLRAGPHFNPLNTNHGGRLQMPFQRHVGDLGNIQEDGEGGILVQFRDYLIQLFGQYTVMGRAIVISQHRDDLGQGASSASITTGEAGEPLACCVIGFSNGHGWLEGEGEEEDRK